MIVKLLIEHHLEFLSLKGGFTGSSESTLVKMPHFWKSHATAHIAFSSHKAFQCSSHCDHKDFFFQNYPQDKKNGLVKTML